MNEEALGRIRRTLTEQGWGGVGTLSGPGVLMLVSALPDTEDARRALEAAWRVGEEEPLEAGWRQIEESSLGA